jgi:hypothetical protein
MSTEALEAAVAFAPAPGMECTTEGCTRVLTDRNISYSVSAFGRPMCSGCMMRARREQRAREAEAAQTVE